MLSMCNIDYKEWMKCQTADRAAASMQIGTLCDIPSIACCNHLLQLEVKFVKEKMLALVSVLTHMQDAFQGIKSNMKNSTILRNLAKCRSGLASNATWIGDRDYLHQHARIEKELAQAHEDMSSNFRINASIAFNYNVKKYEKC